MLRIIFSIFFLLQLILMLGCSPGGTGQSVDERIADDLVKAFFNDFVSGDSDKLLSYYSEEFLRMTPKEQWQKHLQELFTKYGKAKSFSIAGRQVDTRFSGKFYIYRYDTRHNNNKRLKHIITFRRPVDAETKLLLVGHKISE